MIRLGMINDLESIMDVIKEAQTRMKHDGLTQWQNGYPNREIIIEDLHNKNLYVCELEGKIIATMSVFPYDSIYDDIEGKWLNNDPYMAVHRIAISDMYVGKGINQKMLNFIFDHFNVRNIRIDTHPSNTRMIRSLEKQGFKACGTVHVLTDEDSLRIAYHKTLHLK